MHRLIFAFFFVFATIFAGVYVLMQQAIRPAPAPPAQKTEFAKSDDATPKVEAGESRNATLAGDSKAKEDEEQSPSAKSADDPPAKSKKVNKDPNDPAAPKPERSARTSSQRKQKQKQFFSSMPAATPKPRETNGGIWDTDLDRLQGTWRMLDTEYDGERIPDEARNTAGNSAWTSTGSRTTITSWNFGSSR